MSHNHPAIITFVQFAVFVHTFRLHTTKTSASSIVHSKLDYCNSLYYSLPKYQIIVSNTFRMLLLELLSRLQNSNTSLLFWNLFTGLKVLNELNITSHLQNSQYHLAIVSLWPRIYSTSSQSQHTLFTLCHSHQTIIITQSHSLILQTCFTSSLSPHLCSGGSKGGQGGATAPHSKLCPLWPPHLNPNASVALCRKWTVATM